MPREFTCQDCGRAIVAFEPSDEPPHDLCVHCTMFPGWRDDPRLRLVFDPGEATRAPQPVQAEAPR